MTAGLLLLAAVVAAVGYGRCLWIWDHAHDHRAEPDEDARVTDLDTLAGLDVSDRMKRYIERRRAEIETETA